MFVDVMMSPGQRGAINTPRQTIIASSVADPKLLITDPDPTCQVITDPDPDLTRKVISAQDPDPDNSKLSFPGGSESELATLIMRHKTFSPILLKVLPAIFSQ